VDKGTGVVQKMDDDDWGLSFEELDSLERNAAAQLANRNRATSAAAPILLDSPRRTVKNSAPAPIHIDLDSPNKKNWLDADVTRTLKRNNNYGSPQRTAGGANAASCTSPTKNLFGSPQKTVGGISSLSQSPGKKSGRDLKVKLSRDEPGRIAVEAPYHPVSMLAL
jgi:hypothetical protein